MASSDEGGQAGEDYSDPLWDINQASLKMTRPQIVTTRKDIGKKYEDRLNRFRENCEFLQWINEIAQRPTYFKEFLQHLEEAKESYDDLRGPMLARYPIEVSHAFRREQAEIVHQLDVVPAFSKHVKELLKQQPESKTERNVLEWCMYFLMNNCLHSLDVAHDLAKDKGYLEEIRKFLKEMGPKPDKFRHTIVELTLKQIIHMSRVQANSTLLHDANIPKVLLTYTRSADPEFCLTALGTLANIVDSSNTSGASSNGACKILADDDFRLPSQSVDTLMSKIKEAWKSDRKTATGWSFRELLEVVGSLAKNEDNRLVLVQRGCLSALTDLVSSNVWHDEIVALKTLWRLSMNDENRKTMMKHKDLIDAITNKFTSHYDNNVKGLAYGVLRTLKDELAKSSQHRDTVHRLVEREEQARKKGAVNLCTVSEETSLDKESKRGKIFPNSQAVVKKQDVRCSNPSANRGMQVMLSYNRMHREKVTEICMFLLENGFKVWFDQTDMTCDALDVMADGMESSDVICICYSKGYYDSPYCEMEVKYAVSLNKRMVFIKMEDYNPCGWLGIMMGTASYVDYTGKKGKEYPVMRELLLDELLERKKGEQELQIRMAEQKLAVEEEPSLSDDNYEDDDKDDETLPSALSERRATEERMKPEESDEIHTDGPLTDKALNALAKELGPEWKGLVLQLNLKENDIYRCVEENPGYVHGQILDALALWRNRSQDTPAAKLEALISALETAERIDLAEKLKARLPQVEGAAGARGSRLTDPLADQNLRILAGKLGKEWKEVAICLGLTLKVIEQHNFSQDIRTEIFTTLITWRDSNSLSLSDKLEVLVSTLQDADRGDLAYELVDV